MEPESRKKTILFTIIKEHIRTGVPVGSTHLVEKYKLEISPATVRNEMAELEDSGFIIQPHTSAGRIPTEKAYRLYLENIKPKKPTSAEIRSLDSLLQGGNGQAGLKNVAKELAKTTGQAVFWAFERHNFYYTGVSNLLHQPEFAHVNNIYMISVIIDRIDEILEKIYDRIASGTHVFLGDENPFSDFCGSIIVKYGMPKRASLFGVLGPLRMNYEKNLGIVEHIYKKLAS